MLVNPESPFKLVEIRDFSRARDVSSEVPRKPLFLCVLGCTDTARIPGVSAAGKSPELTELTPAGDAELVWTGESLSLPVPPMTPSGAPTPAVITRAALQLSGVPSLFVNSGLRVKPRIPTLDMDAAPGRDIRQGRAVEEPEEIYRRGVLLGRELSKGHDFVVIGESIPGGTTTALGVLQALGCQARVSSSFPDNPVEIKEKAVSEGMKKAGITHGSKRDDPWGAVAALGDPMMPAALGIASGLKNVRTVLAGGTQMIAVLALLKALKTGEGISIATTRFVADDPTANFLEMTETLGARAYITDPGFADSRIAGLHNYEAGEVKEGVGAGGAMLLAALSGADKNRMREKVEEVYRQVF